MNFSESETGEAATAPLSGCEASSRPTVDTAEAVKAIDRAVEEAIAVKRAIGPDLKSATARAAALIADALGRGGRLLALGNGGSAADAQHFAAELVGRFLKERRAYDVMALTTNSSTLTCLINDYPPERVFERQVHAHARAGDVVVGISTSGNSDNVILALRAARELGATAIGLTGETGGRMAEECDCLLAAPSRFTPRIQETHIFLIHLICGLVEDRLAANEDSEA